MEKFSTHSKGFTLIEILIVGALIALFAGMAIINIQQQYENSVRKIMIGESREIGTAMSFAHQDLGIFPKFCFLNHSRNMLFQVAGTNRLPLSFDYMGFDVTGREQQLIEGWRGGYFAMSQSRGNITQGRRGGIVKAWLLEDNIAIDWPADAWGNPYVLYLLYLMPDGAPDFILTPSHEPDFFCAVVSYGPNRVPGGETNMSAAQVDSLRQYRIFSDYTGTEADYTIFPVNSYTRNHALVYSNRYATFLGNLPGITDPGSDDIVFEF